MSEKKRTFEQAAQDIDLRLGDVLGHLGSALDEVVSRLGDAQDGGEIRRERRFDTEKGPIRASAGIRIRSLGDTASVVAPQPRSPDKPINPNRKAPTPTRQGQQKDPSVRDVEATIIQDGEVWMMVAEMPGIARDQITWHVNDGLLRVEGRNDTRHYRIDTDWPETASPNDLECHVANGIVELRTKDSDAGDRRE